MTREEWKAFSTACRTAAAARLRPGCTATSTFGFEAHGTQYTLSVERTKSPAFQNTGQVWGKPVRLYTSRLSERPRRALQAESLEWCARYRKNVRADGLRSHRRRMSVEAVRHELAECRALGSAFAALP